MSEKSKTELTAELIANITDPLNNQNTASRVREIIQDVIDSNQNIVDGPKRYKAVMSQTADNAPIAVRVYENTIGNIIWTYNGVGSYSGTLEGAFIGALNVPTRSGFCIPTNNAGSFIMSGGDPDSIQLYTINYLTDSFSDDFLNNTLIIIEVYP